MIADQSKTATTPLLDAAERTLGALWDATPDTLPLLERWRLVERAAVVLERDGQHDTAGRVLLGLLALGLVLTVAYALLSIAALAWFAAAVYALAVAAWAWVRR
jgi:hypothetical protein